MKKYLIYLFLIILPALIACSDSDGSNGTYPYHTNEDLDVFFDEIKLNYPSITSIETVGYSESGRVIKALIISDNPYKLEGEPAVRLAAGIHGDERSGIELLVRFIEYLTSNYKTDSDVRYLIKNRYICIIPVLNPDGLAYNTRYNNHGVDLNRNFSEHWQAGSDHGAYAFSETESRALRDFSTVKHFNLSISYHTGSVLVNMPFDFGRELDGIVPVQYTLVKEYALAYTQAGTFLSNPDLYQSPYMDRGTINGGNWYVITGSLQDWSYTNTGCLDLTIEVADFDPVSGHDVEQIFLYNRDSLMAYISMAGTDLFSGK